MPQGDYTDPDTWWRHYAPAYEGRTWKDSRHLLAESIVHAEGGPLLDVGCGLGFLVECARRFGLEAYGLEASVVALERARALHPEAEIASWNAGEPLPFRDSSIGIAVLNEFVDHIDLPSNRLLFAELRRVLAPKGTLLVKSPSRHNKFDDDLGHVTFFSPSEFRAFVESFGFTVIAQPFSPQPLLGNSRLGKLSMRVLGALLPLERLAARIDLIAAKPNGGER